MTSGDNNSTDDDSSRGVVVYVFGGYFLEMRVTKVDGDIIVFNGRSNTNDGGVCCCR